MSGHLLPVALLIGALQWASGEGTASTCSTQLPAAVARKLVYEEPYHLLEELAKASDDEGVLTRTFLSPSHIQAAHLLQDWMAQAGMATWQDNVANVHGRTDGYIQNSSAVVIASHYDTVVDGGKYDGALGIVAGIAAVKARMAEEALCRGYLTAGQLEAAAGAAPVLDLRALVGARPLALPQAVHVIGFSDEEGVRFQSTFLGSRAVVGELGGLLSMQDREGVSVRQALEAKGFATAQAAVEAMRLRDEQMHSYMEVHIEQGPVLERLGLPVGVVAGIAGQTRLFASMVGEQGHAGTVPMSMRRDPMPAAGLATAKLEELCRPELEANQKSNMVCTVGAIHVHPNAGNVIPRYTNFTIDIRGQFDERRLEVVRDISAFIRQTCAARGLQCELELKNEAASVHSDKGTMEALAAATRAAADMLNTLITGNGSKAATGEKLAPGSPDVPVLVSGAGHDAMVMAKHAKMGMLFVRCRKGISHSPEEFASKEDVAMGTAALYSFLKQQGAAGAAGSRDEL